MRSMTDTNEVQYLELCDAIVENWTDFNIPNVRCYCTYCKLLRYLLRCDLIVLYDLNRCYTVLMKVPLCSSSKLPLPI